MENIIIGSHRRRRPRLSRRRRAAPGKILTSPLRLSHEQSQRLVSICALCRRAAARHEAARALSRAGARSPRPNVARSRRKPFERLTYRVCGIDPAQEQGWLGYALALLAFSLVGLLFTYFILRFQDHLPLNPQHLPGVSPRARVQHRREFHHQHQLAELRRRIDDVVFFADGRADHPQLHVGGRRHRHRRRPRPRASPGRPRRPSATSGSIRCASLTTCSLRSASSSRCSSFRRA